MWKNKGSIFTALLKVWISPYEVSFTNFILVHVGGDSSQAADALLKKGVIIRDMAAWGLKGYIRVSIGSASENKRFIKTLGEIL